MTIKAIGFDMDGTLVNTHVNYVDLNDVNRFVLQPLGFPVDEMWPDGNMTSRQPFYDWMVRNGRRSEIAKYDRLLDERCLEVERLGMTGSKVYSGIFESLEWLKDIHTKLPRIDVLSMDCWIHDFDEHVADFNPKLIISQHENEIGVHGIDHRESYWMTMYKNANFHQNPTPYVLMTWGEWYDY